METPKSLFYLVEKAISSLSASILKRSTPSGEFPKEAVFQHLLMDGLSNYTPPSCHICPELSKNINSENSDQTANGEIDFYLNGELQWGIELLVNGDGIGEHISRFEPPHGKYVALEAADYAVVDFRKSTSGRPTEYFQTSKKDFCIFQRG